MLTALISYTWDRIHWGYDAVYDKTITLFNRYSSRLGDTWYPTIIHNVQLIVDKSAIIAQYGAESRDSALLHVKYKNVNGKIIIAEKPYKTPKEWDRQTNDLLSQTITFADGQNFDFFMLGEYESEEPINDDAYIDGFYNYINSNYDNVFAITAVGLYSLIPHFEITGK